MCGWLGKVRVLHREKLNEKKFVATIFYWCHLRVCAQKIDHFLSIVIDYSRLGILLV